MTIQVGESLPHGILQEYQAMEAEGCRIGPNDFVVTERARGKRVLLFGLPGAFTPTCSAKHIPGYLEQHAALMAAGIDEIWCLSVNDAFVMHAWGLDQHVGDKIRMLADGNADYTRQLGLELDLTGRGMGWRSQRYAMLVADGVVQWLAVEPPGQFGVSSAAAVLHTLQASST